MEKGANPLRTLTVKFTEKKRPGSAMGEFHQRPRTKKEGCTACAKSSILMAPCHGSLFIATESLSGEKSSGEKEGKRTRDKKDNIEPYVFSENIKSSRRVPKYAG
ncbi:hypothetical protein MAR_ORF358 [Marseillevirus marseillevirus]|uniref:Uncharacterized protein n=1 Tax=Marseillevirus marseillevirus TaxID=694581 RepID=D2XAZ7_GBMV|nr:hypothetical protein MAR_ORF358 [Marseillevirus marseillevirus]ADB04124.1 hypothetical protein MAR_ORF358 [Marseillevirus marseillevirus]